MISTYFRDSSPTMKILLTVMFCLAGMLLFMLIGMITIYALYGAGASGYISNPNPSTHEAIVSLKILQLCQAIGLFVLPGFLLSMYFSEKPLQYLGFKRINLNLTILSVLTIFFAFPAINLLASLNEQIALPDWMNGMEEKAKLLTKAFMQVDSFGGFAVNILMIAILPAVGEELIFRGILQRLFSEITGKVFWGVIISAALFSAMHLQFQGFLPRFALGVLLSYLYVWSGSIWLPIIAHFINNMIAVVGYMLIYKGSIPQKVENVGSISEMWFLGLISFIAVFALLWKIRSERAID